jgi:hypothetical protein
MWCVVRAVSCAFHSNYINEACREFGCTPVNGATQAKTKEEEETSSESEDELLAAGRGNRGASAGGPVMPRKVADLNAIAAGKGGPAMSRREREAAEKKRKEEHFWRMQQEGKTEQARADLARLNLIRQQREAAAAKKAAEAEDRAANSQKAESLRTGKSILSKSLGGASVPVSGPAGGLAGAKSRK